jgi:hypothetical protein
MSVFGCPEIGEEDLVINNGTVMIDSPQVTVRAFASGATRVLLSERVNALDAIYAPLGGSIPFTFSDEPGEKTLYAWFGNACQRAFVQSIGVELVSGAIPPSPPPEEETGSGEISVPDADPPAPDEDLPWFVEEDPALEERPPQLVVWNKCVTYASFSEGLGLGDEGPEVAELQQLMTCFSLFPADRSPNGEFGIHTQRAVSGFQKVLGLEVTGTLTAETLQALAPYMLTP